MRLLTGELLESRYGGRRGYLTHLAALLRSRCGAFNAYRVVDWRHVDRLIFVCMGNVCRSPYAEARVRQRGGVTDSFGLEVQRPSPAEPFALEVARERGISLDQHQSAPLVGEELRVGDLLVGMEPMHMEAIAARGLDKICQSTLLGLWSRPMRPHIYDPMGRSIGYFRTCYTVIDSAVEQILHRIWEQKSERGIGVPTGGGA